MPCIDNDHWPNQAEEAWRRVDQLTQLLCEACEQLGDWGWDRASAELRAWWQAHQEADRKRLAEEQAQAQRRAVYGAALAKLTDEEKQILGLS